VIVAIEAGVIFVKNQSCKTATAALQRNGVVVLRMLLLLLLHCLASTTSKK
jgi:hypothetical protein